MLVNLYNNKRGWSDCNSYRGISLLSIVGKVFARILLPPLQVLAAHVYPESQRGFWAGRSTSNIVSPYDNCRRNVMNRTRPYTSPSEI